MRPPLCDGGMQQSWFGSFCPFSMAAEASSWATVGQHGQPLRQRHGQQSIRPDATRCASNVAKAAKKKTCSTKSMSTDQAAYMQKEESAGSAELTEMAKATKSVREVTMIEMPAWEMAAAMRFGTGSIGSVRSKAFMITKESSTPMATVQAKASSARDWILWQSPPKFRMRYMIMIMKAPLMSPTSPRMTLPKASLKERSARAKILKCSES